MKPSLDGYPLTSVPQFMTWEIPPADFNPPGWSSPLRWWQAGRCAMCADQHSPLTQDHDHQTGMIRGLLCRSCNISEARSVHPAFAAWRAGRNPATLLGYDCVYISPFTGRPATTAIYAATSDAELDIIANAVVR